MIKCFNCGFSTEEEEIVEIETKPISLEDFMFQQGLVDIPISKKIMSIEEASKIYPHRNKNRLGSMCKCGGGYLIEAIGIMVYRIEKEQT